MQGQLEHFGQVEIARQGIVLLAKGARFDAATGAPRPGIFQRLALPE